VDAREERIVRNEVLFRAVNERIEDINATFGDDEGGLAIVCECGEETCAARITLPIAEYEQVRRDPTLFIITPGHDEPDVETVVQRTAGYDVVRKDQPEALEYAEEVDERS
jgi:hypothetical protein